MSEERERIKGIIKEVIEVELNMNRKEFPKRLNHIRDQMLFKIDNPNYIRKKREESN